MHYDHGFLPISKVNQNKQSINNFLKHSFLLNLAYHFNTSYTQKTDKESSRLKKAKKSVEKPTKETAEPIEILDLSEEVAQVSVEELPEKVQIIEIQTLDGSMKQQVVKKRTIKKLKGLTQEITEIVTKQEENLAPVTSVTVTESLIEESTEPLSSLENTPQAAHIVEEMPEVVEISHLETKEGPKKQITKKRVIKKKTGRKESITEIVTKQTEGQKPITSVKVTEIDLPLEEITEIVEPLKLKKFKAQETLEELPEHIQVFETQSLEGPKKKTIVKKRTIKKKKGDKEEITEILTKQVEGEIPETVVIVSEIEAQPDEVTETLKKFEEKPEQATMPNEEAEECKPELIQLLVEFMKKTAAPILEEPKEEETFENVVEDGKVIKKIVKRRVTKKKKVSPDEDDDIKRLLELEVFKTPLEDYEKVYNYTLFDQNTNITLKTMSSRKSFDSKTLLNNKRATYSLKTVFDDYCSKP